MWPRLLGEVESVYRPMGDEKLIDELAAPGRRPS
jgi:hypothetical protein